MSKLLFRESRLYLLIWIVALIWLAVVNIGALAVMFNTQEMWTQYVETISAPVSIIFCGPGIGITPETINLGAAFIGKLYTMMMIAMVIMNTVFTVNWNRGFEEDGRTELLLSHPVKRHVLQKSSFGIMSAINFSVTVAVCMAFIAYGEKPLDSIIFHIGVFIFAEIIAVLGMLSSAVFATARVAKFAVIGAFIGLYCIGAYGWVEGVTGKGLGHFEWYSWVSPVTWVFDISPFANGLNYAPLALLAGVLLVLLVIIYFIYKTRDMGASLLTSRDGRQNASVLLNSMFALRFRMTRNLLVGWSIGLAAVAAAYGSMLNTVINMIKDSPQISQLMSIDVQTGQQALQSTQTTVIQGFVGYILVFLFFVISGFCISNVGSNILRDEKSGVFEVFLSKPLKRASYLCQMQVLIVIMALVVSAAMLAGFGFSSHIATPDAISAPEFLTAGVHGILIPIFFAGLTIFLFCLNAKFTNCAWIYFGFCIVTQLFSDLLKVPDWIQNVNILKHFGEYPVGDFFTTSWCSVLGICIFLYASSFVLYRRRDLLNS